MSSIHNVLSGEVKLTVEVIGQGAPLVFAHGLTSRRHSILAQFTDLVDRYQIVAFDQRGHGQSDPITVPALFDPSLMAQDIGVVMDSMGIEQAIVGGESMGVATALLFALQNPARIRALLLTAPAIGGNMDGIGREQIREMGRAIESLGLEGYLQHSAEFQRTQLGWPPEATAYLAQMQGGHNSSSLATACLAVAEWRILQDLSPLRSLVCPVCIVAWPGDLLHPIELAREMHLTFPQADLIEIDPLPAVFLQPATIGQAYGVYLSRLEG